jgi:hypothetical protein
MREGLEIEEEVDEGTLESGTCSGVEDITASTDLGGPLQIKEAKAFPNGDVIFGIHRSGFTPVLDGHIPLCITSLGETGCREIRHLKE